MATKHPLRGEKPRRTGQKGLQIRAAEDNHENGKKQFIYAMNIKSNGKSRYTTIIELAEPLARRRGFGSLSHIEHRRHYYEAASFYKTRQDLLRHFGACSFMWRRLLFIW